MHSPGPPAWARAIWWLNHGQPSRGCTALDRLPGHGWISQLHLAGHSCTIWLTHLLPVFLNPGRQHAAGPCSVNAPLNVVCFGGRGGQVTHCNVELHRRAWLMIPFWTTGIWCLTMCFGYSILTRGEPAHCSCCCVDCLLKRLCQRDPHTNLGCNLTDEFPRRLL
jgi:hypothetical protein